MYQKTELQRGMNEFILKPELLADGMAEIELIRPHLQVCLAPKTNRKKQGAAALRTGEHGGVDSSSPQSRIALNDSAKILYNWLGPQPSRIRMLMTFQAQGGMSFVALAHHKCAQAFRNHGNAEHQQGEGSPVVPLAEFQDVPAEYIVSTVTVPLDNSYSSVAKKTKTKSPGHSSSTCVWQRRDRVGRPRW